MFDKSTSEPLLEENPRRFVLFPIKYLAIWRAYKKAVTTFWIADTIQTSEDAEEWKNKLNDTEKQATTLGLKFLEATHKTMHEKLLNAISTEVTAPEVRCFFSFQTMTENIHTEALSKFISRLTDDQDRPVLDLDDHSFKEKFHWALNWTDDTDIPFADRLVALVAIKSLFTSSLFCVLSWISERDILSSLSFTSSMIALDTESHVDFACLLFHHLKKKPSQDRVFEIVAEAVDLEKDFGTVVFQNINIDVTMEQLHGYIEFLADILLRSLGYETYYKVTNPIPFIQHLPGEVKAGYIAQQMETAYSLGSSKGLEIRPQVYDFFKDHLT